LNEISESAKLTPKISLHLGIKLNTPLGSAGGHTLATAMVAIAHQNAFCSDRRSEARSAPINFSFLSFNRRSAPIINGYNKHFFNFRKELLNDFEEFFLHNWFRSSVQQAHNIHSIALLLLMGIWANFF